MQANGLRLSAPLSTLRSAEAPDVRKLVTLVFSDLKGSTKLGEGREAIDLYDAKENLVLAAAARGLLASIGAEGELSSEAGT